MKKVAILQSNYIPWKGYFDMIASVDEFVLYDDMQYTKNDWRNRNQIKTAQGVQWISVPILASGRFGQTIHEAEIKGGNGRLRIGKACSKITAALLVLTKLPSGLNPFISERPTLICHR